MSQITPSEIATYPGVETLDESDYHELVGVKRRRTTLRALAEMTAPVDLDDLAAAVAKREIDPAGVEPTVNDIATELHHIHLPKMDNLGVIDYEPSANRIALSFE